MQNHLQSQLRASARLAECAFFKGFDSHSAPALLKPHELSEIDCLILDSVSFVHLVSAAAEVAGARAAGQRIQNLPCGACALVDKAAELARTVWSGSRFADISNVAKRLNRLALAFAPDPNSEVGVH